MEMEQIVNYILQWGPSVVSIVTMISTVVVAIKKVQNANDVNLKETKKLQHDLHSVIFENSELKRDIRKMVEEIHHIRSRELNGTTPIKDNEQFKKDVEKLNIKNSTKKGK